MTAGMYLGGQNASYMCSNMPVYSRYTQAGLAAALPTAFLQSFMSLGASAEDGLGPIDCKKSVALKLD